MLIVMGLTLLEMELGGLKIPPFSCCVTVQSFLRSLITQQIMVLKEGLFFMKWLVYHKCIEACNINLVWHQGLVYNEEWSLREVSQYKWWPLFLPIPLRILLCAEYGLSLVSTIQIKNSAYI